jgi:CheY-like chemotaxis protein
MKTSLPSPTTVSAEGRQFNGAPFPASVTAEGAQLNVPPFPPPTIIVPHDHPFDISLMRWVFDAHELPYELQVIEHGDYALYVFDLPALQEYLRPPTVVLCHLNLPQLDGNELLRHIQAIPPGADIRVVAVISSADAKEQVEALGLGADGSFGPPYHLASFMQIGEFIKDIVYGSATVGEPLQAATYGTMRRPRAGPQGSGGRRRHPGHPASGTPPRAWWQRGLIWGVGLGLLVGLMWGAPWLLRQPPLVPTSLQMRSDYVAALLPTTTVPAARPMATARPRGAGTTPGSITPGRPLQPPQASVARSAAHRGPNAAAQPRAVRAGHQRPAERRHATPRPAALKYLIQARAGAGALLRPREVMSANRPGEWPVVQAAPQPLVHRVAPDPAPEVERPWNRRLVNDGVGE